MSEAAKEQSQVEYERHIGGEAKVEIYEAALKRSKREAEKPALQKIREEVRKELEAEKVGSHVGKLMVDFGAGWNEDKEAAMRKEVQDKRHETLSQMRKNRASRSRQRTSMGKGDSCQNGTCHSGKKRGLTAKPRVSRTKNSEIVS